MLQSCNAWLCQSYCACYYMCGTLYKDWKYEINYNKYLASASCIASYNFTISKCLACR